MTELMGGHASASVEPECRFTVRARFDDPHVMEIVGELDLASRTAAIDACSSSGHLDVLVDMSGLVFMDCAGYDALDAAKTILERRGGSLVLMNPVGEPLRLLELIDLLELVPCGPLRIRARPTPPEPCCCVASLVDR